MSPYKLVILRNGSIDRVMSFAAEDDDDARHLAEVQRYGRQAELWNANRVFARFSDDALDR
jgi:hypothetical protein